MKKRMIYMIMVFILFNTTVVPSLGEIPIPKIFTSGYYEYSFDIEGADGGVAIVKYFGNDTILEVPDTLGSYPVKAIGYCAFAGNDCISSVTLPKSMTIIASGAFFGCEELESLILPDSLIRIESKAFTRCNNLTYLTLPNSLQSIGTNPFSYTPVTIEISPNNRHFSLSGGVLYEEQSKTLISYPYGSLITSYTIPNGTLSIGNDAFHGCSDLVSVVLPEGLKSVGDEAFAFCDNLTSLTLPESLTSIGNIAFFYCEKLTSVKLPSNLKSIGTNAFLNCENLTLEVHPGTYAAQWAETSGIEYQYLDATH